MNNPETSVTLGAQDTGQHVDSRYIRFTLYNSTCFLLTCIKICQRRAQNGFLILLVNKRYRQPKWQSRTDNPETSATLGTQDTGQRQSRDIGNTGHTKHRTKTVQRHRQHWAHNTQDKDNP